MISAPVARAIEEAVGARVVRLDALHGGCVAAVFRVHLEDGCDLVAKQSIDGADLALEAYMLRYLRERGGVPVPAVRHASRDLLVMDYLESGDAIDGTAEHHAAELIAALHGHTAETYGHERDTVIGGLHQPNPPSKRWLEFFRDFRLLHMAREALAARQISPRLMSRIERFAARLGDFIAEPAAPALIHGDLWAGNILVKSGRVAGFVDPAIYYADPEIELAFATLFNGLGESFFRRYGELRTIGTGFFEARCHIYNLYPLLVHARLFGGHYPSAVERVLNRFGG